MEKKYDHEKLKPEENRISEPAIEYGVQPDVEMEQLPVLKEEEIENLITGEQLLERVLPRIKKLFE